MEEEMDRLATNMDAITDFSAKISGTLQDRREQITKLSSVHMLLKKVRSRGRASSWWALLSRQTKMLSKNLILSKKGIIKAPITFKLCTVLVLR